MSCCRPLRRSGIAGLILGLASVVGCGGGEPPPPTDVPGRPGPAIPAGVLKKGAAGKKGGAKAGALNPPNAGALK
jgi:hypothetical protein